MLDNTLLECIAKLKHCSAPEMSMFLKLLHSECTDNVVAGLCIMPPQFRADLSELFSFSDKNYVKFNCPECKSEQYVIAEVVEAGKCTQCVHEPSPGYYELDWDDSLDFDVRRVYCCEECGAKLADTITELEEVIKAANGGYVKIKEESTKTTNEELGILGK